MGKYNLEIAREIVSSKGFELVSDQPVNIKSKLVFKDSEGYYYEMSLDNFIRNKQPVRFTILSNYLFQNIDLFMRYNNYDYKLIKIIYERGIYIQFSDSKGYLYYMALNNFLKGHLTSAFNKNNKHVIDNLKLWCVLNDKNFKLISTKFNGNAELLKWQCLKDSCKEIFLMNWSDIQQGTQCPYCCGRRAGLSNCLATKNPELASQWHPTLNGELTPYDVTCGSHKYIIWKCKECGYEWEAQVAKRALYNRGCPECNKSKGEKQLDIILTQYNVPHNSQYTFDNLVGIGGNLLRFDVPVFWDVKKTNLRMLIEYDGIQHFEWVKGWITKKEFKRIQIHDQLKNEYCKNNNIKLIRIPYWDFENIEEILKRELNIHITNNSNLTVVF